MENKWNYMVSFSLPDTVTANWHFNGLRSAFARFSQLMPDAFVYRPGHSAYFTNPQITDLKADETVVSLMEIPISFALEGDLPGAGVYLYVHCEDLPAFQKSAKINFTDAPMYDPDIPFLPVAHYKYRTKLTLEADRYFKHFSQRLNLEVGHLPTVRMIEMRFNGSEQNRAADNPPPQIHHIYEHVSVQEGLDHLMSIPVLQFQKDLAYQAKYDHYFDQVQVLDAWGYNALEIQNLAVGTTGNRQLLLTVNANMRQSLTIDKRPLRSLPLYKEDSRQLPILTYDATSLQHTVEPIVAPEIRSQDATPMVLEPQTNAYSVQIRWEQLNNNGVTSYSTHPAATFQEALQQILALDDRLFSRTGATQLAFPFFINSVSVQSGLGTGNELLCLKNIGPSEDPDQFVVLNEDRLSETTNLIRPFLKDPATDYGRFLLVVELDESKILGVPRLIRPQQGFKASRDKGYRI